MPEVEELQFKAVLKKLDKLVPEGWKDFIFGVFPNEVANDTERLMAINECLAVEDWG